jgi:YVTN family beta-propeller protein
MRKISFLPFSIAILFSACSTGGKNPPVHAAATEEHRSIENPLPGMPPVLDPNDIYSADRANALDPAVQGFVSRIYVPNTISDTVDVIDPATYRVVDHFKVGRQPQHVTPSWDLKTLWVLNDKGDSLTRIDPRTGKLGDTVPVLDPYNLY